MIQQVVRDLKVSGQPIYRYQIDDGHDLLDFDIQFMPYDAESVFLLINISLYESWLNVTLISFLPFLFIISKIIPLPS